ncbi:ATP-binding protein [Streptomyces sp. NPDC059785]|uniref:ATP-binding protein n=1 Tax=Streptomyces sp. NPDC059785 TaxID=3346945 RepID=UPI003656EC72
MPGRTPEAASWVLAVAVPVLAVLLLLRHRAHVRQRERNARLADRLRAWENEVRHLVAVRLPRPADEPWPPGPGRAAAFLDTGPLDARLAGTAVADCLDHVLERFVDAVEQARTAAERSARAALREAVGPVEALALAQQSAIAEAQDRHDDPGVLRDLLGIDHLNAQLGHRAQALAVLCGAPPRREHPDTPLLDVVRGAVSRVRDYRRIRVTGPAGRTVAGRAVAPVVLALAELLDNAARHSPPDTTVEAVLETGPDGARVLIDDAGTGLRAEDAEYAADVLTGPVPVPLARLGDPPRLGLAVAGTLAARYGFAVTVDARSPHGGVRAVVSVPAELLGAGDAGDAKHAGDTGHGAADAAEEPAVTAGGLPRRRRRRGARGPQRSPAEGRTSGTATGPAAGAESDEAILRAAEENARRVSAFAEGFRRGRAEGGGPGTAPGAEGVESNGDGEGDGDGACGASPLGRGAGEPGGDGDGEGGASPPDRGAGEPGRDGDGGAP